MGKTGKSVKTLIDHFNKIYANQNSHTRGNLIVKRKDASKEVQALTSKKAHLYLLKSSDSSKEKEANVFSMETSSNDLADGNKMSDVTNTIKNFEIFQKPQIINTTKTVPIVEKSESIDFFKIELLRKSNEFIEKNKLKYSNEANRINNTTKLSIIRYDQSINQSQPEINRSNTGDNNEAYRLLYSKIKQSYATCIKQVETKLSPVIVQAILDIDLTQNVSKRTSSAQPKLAERHTIETFIEKLNEMIIIFKTSGVDPLIMNQIVRQLFYLIDAQAFNNLLREKLCNWSKGAEIRKSIAILENWLQTNKFEDSNAHIELEPIKQAVQLIQDFSSVDDIKKACEMCPVLTIRQIKRILFMYTTSCGLNLSIEFVNNVIIALKENRSVNHDSDNLTLELDINKILPIFIPINQRYAKILNQLIADTN